jgi:hypothetical protein
MTIQNSTLTLGKGASDREIDGLLYAEQAIWVVFAISSGLDP